MHRKKKHKDPSWDYRGEDTKQFTHCLHRYPAQMIPQIARRLIETFGKPGELLFDPYCGSGTSLVEGLLFGMNVVGCDINPLAIMIRKAKTDKMDMGKLKRQVARFEELLMALNVELLEERTTPIIPDVTNMDYWFPRTSQNSLGVLKSLIGGVSTASIRNFLNVAFSETVRESSYTRSGEFKLFRIPKEKMRAFRPDVYEIFMRKVRRNLKGYSQFVALREMKTCKVHLHSTVSSLPKGLPKYQLVVTSPPYGDSRTTVAYGQFSTLPLEWLGFKEARKIDGLAMGGKSTNGETLTHSPSLRKVLNRIAQSDEKRAGEVLSFFIDLDHSIRNVAGSLKRKGYACYVVGNRTVKSIKIPLDEIVVEFFEACGLRHCDTAIRSIPNKAMPSMNSPTNAPGILEQTMTEEYIVVMQKR